tara:strand:- start:317 stop:592 length:276 start_codon:yes stop_codon:yes gene_type:complete
MEGNEDDRDSVPPVPPLPSTLTAEGTAVHDHALTEVRKGRSVRRSLKSRGGQSYQASPWGEDVNPTVDLESLLRGIEVGGEQKGNVARPPY